MQSLLSGGQLLASCFGAWVISAVPFFGWMVGRSTAASRLSLEREFGQDFFLVFPRVLCGLGLLPRTLWWWLSMTLPILSRLTVAWHSGAALVERNSSKVSSVGASCWQVVLALGSSRPMPFAAAGLGLGFLPRTL